MRPGHTGSGREGASMKTKNNRQDDPLTSASKFLALVLRHKPEEAGIELDGNGWADVCEMLDGMRQAGCRIDRQMLERIVQEDAKGRYAFNEDHTKIRARQGHSIPVDVGLSKSVPPDILWHGTGEKFSGSIDKKGLIPKSRLYVHLSKDRNTARDVGSRHGKPVLYRVDAAQMHRDGHAFFLSENNVWLVKAVPPEYLSKEE